MKQNHIFSMSIAALIDIPRSFFAPKANRANGGAPKADSNNFRADSQKKLSRVRSSGIANWPMSLRAALGISDSCSGAGDRIVAIKQLVDPCLVRISGDAQNGRLIVRNYDAQGAQISELVNQSGLYSGIHPLNFRVGEQTAYFDVRASGAWTIELLPLSEIQRARFPGMHQGTGDAVFAVDGIARQGYITVSGNDAGKPFAAWSYCQHGARLLCQTAVPLRETFKLDSTTIIISVQATGDWMVEID